MVSQFVTVVKSSRWGETTCPICLTDLIDPNDIIVALVSCEHSLHLSCLNKMLTAQKSQVYFCNFNIDLLTIFEVYFLIITIIVLEYVYSMPRMSEDLWGKTW